MTSKKIILSAFVLVALVQLFVPAKMIWDREEVLENGIEYKFMTAPVDPSDPFRGKFITLNFSENTVEIENENDWTWGETIYLHLAKDDDGFAKIKSASKERPTDGQEFMKAKVQYVTRNHSNEISIEYPFDRFYMEESKAYEAEQAYIETQSDTINVTYALVSINDGDAVLKDVLINGIPIAEIVKTNQAVYAE